MKWGAVILAVAAVILVSGCTQAPAPHEYEILHQIDYDQDLCGGTGYKYEENGFNTGIMVVPIDPEGNNVSASIRFMTRSSDSMFSFSDSFDCEEDLNTTDAAILVSAPGYAPKAVRVELLRDKLFVIGVPLKRSCTGEKGCFETNRLISLVRSEGSQTAADEGERNLREWFYGELSDEFLLENPQLDCTECNYGRGGYLKANGTQDGVPFKLYYRTGWCSPGGGDCGWTLCFSEEGAQPSDAYAAIKSKLCGEIEFYNLTEYHPTPDTYSYNRTNDITNETRLACQNGGFEYVSGDRRTISIVQDSSRSGAFATKGGEDCLAL